MYQIEKSDVDRFTVLLRETRELSDWDNYYDNLFEQMSKTEFIIQHWWADKIDLIGKDVNILNSGVGFYSVPMCFEKGAHKVRTYDMCPVTDKLAWRINKPYRNEDLSSTINYSHHNLDVTFDCDMFESADVYINTSCEHSFPMKEVIPDNSYVVLSSNNLTKRGHINKIESTRDLIKQAGITEVHFKHEQVFDFEDDLGFRNYKQFFVIGKKG